MSVIPGLFRERQREPDVRNAWSLATASVERLARLCTYREHREHRGLELLRVDEHEQ